MPPVTAICSLAAFLLFSVKRPCRYNSRRTALRRKVVKALTPRMRSPIAFHRSADAVRPGRRSQEFYLRPDSIGCRLRKRLLVNDSVSFASFKLKKQVRAEETMLRLQQTVVSDVVSQAAPATPAGHAIQCLSWARSWLSPRPQRPRPYPETPPVGDSAPRAARLLPSARSHNRDPP